jgi:adenylate cyclase
MASTRRLVAILAADVAGYSRLMGLDEEGTHEGYKAHTAELLFPTVRQHHGRLVKSTGDGFLAEFASAVDAARCAVEIQCGMVRRNTLVAEDQRISFRIGVNCGDVIAEPQDVFGNVVNIAARLEGFAQPNGICISAMVYEQVRDRLPYPFEDLGLCDFKNIARPVHAFAMSPASLMTIAAAYSDAAISSPILPSPLSGLRQNYRRRSIVVLPFTDLSPTRDRQYLADAITEDVTTDLSRITDMVVISGNTAFRYKDEPIDIWQIGRELNVRYVLTGSIRGWGNRVRVNTQLIDAETSAHIWGERLDYETQDLFALQDEITGRIAVALDLELVSVEAARAIENPDALDFTLRGRAALYNNKGSTRQNFETAIELFEKARALDPASADIQALLGLTLVARVLEQMTDCAAADLDRAEGLIRQALETMPRHPVAHFARGQILRAHRQYEAAIPEYEAAIAQNRNWVVAIAAFGLCKSLTGAIEEAIPAQEHAIRLSPRDPRVPNWFWRIGMVHLLQSRIDEAVLWLERARSANPSLPGPHAWLSAACALKGNMPSAANELAEARRLSGDGRYRSIASYKDANFLGSPKIHILAEETFFAGLRKAGVPDK